MRKSNLRIDTLAILEVTDELNKIRSTPVEILGAEKLLLERDAVARLLSLMGAYNFEAVLDTLDADKRGAA